MLQENIRQAQSVETAVIRGVHLYRAAGVGVLISVVFIVLDIGLSFTGGDMPVGASGAAAWFAHMHNNWFVGLRNLGIFNVINPLLTLPLYLVLFQTHRKSSPASTAMALSLWLIGVAVYIANNQALTMLSLSSQYAAATTEAQKSLLVTAGTVILAQSEDFTPGTFLGFFLQNVGSIWMVAVMLQGKIFKRWLGLLGLAGMSSLLVFTISATFAPATLNLAMIFALFGGLLMLAWNIRMGLNMFRMGGSQSKQKTESTALSGLEPGGKGV